MFAKLNIGAVLCAALVTCFVFGLNQIQAQTPVYGRDQSTAESKVKLRQAPIVKGTAIAQATVANGSFETGTFASWNVADTCGTSSSGWFVNSGTVSPISGMTIPAPPVGNFAAITDQNGPGTNILYQDLALEAGSTHTLSMTLYFNNRHTANVTPADFNLDCSDALGNPNQQYRVDIIRTSASLTSVNPSDILMTIFWTANLPTNQLSMPPTPFSVDLTAFGGQTVRLRFAEVDNQLFYQAGVDNVQLTSTPVLNVPGIPLSVLSDISDQKAGSILFYNLYTSGAATPNAQNTRINISNVNPNLDVAVHLFFIDGDTCSIADRYVCLTRSQTMTFLVSEFDPGINGYLVAVATDLTGCPISFNYLIGDAFVKLQTGHAANLGAEAIAAISAPCLPCLESSSTALLNFDGICYNRVPRVLASSGIPARGDGNDTLLVLNRVGGDLMIAASTLSSVFGLLFNDAEAPHSFTFTAGCQRRSTLSNAFPRTSPRFEVVIPSGGSGWMKLWAVGDLGVLGAQINFNANASTSAGAFNQGRNLHKLRFKPLESYRMPIFPPNC